MTDRKYTDGQYREIVDVIDTTLTGERMHKFGRGEGYRTLKEVVTNYFDVESTLVLAFDEEYKTDDPFARLEVYDTGSVVYAEPEITDREDVIYEGWDYDMIPAFAELLARDDCWVATGSVEMITAVEKHI